MALSSGSQENDILILEPTTTAWLYDSYVNRNPKQAEIGQSFQTFITTLEKNQVEYDLGSENIIKNIGDVKDGKFIVGQGTYSVVVIPPMTENLDLSTYKLIKKFVINGGKLIAFSTPTLVDGSQNEGLNEFMAKQSEKITIENELTKEVIDKHFKSNSIAFSGIAGGDLYHHRRILSDGQVLFLINSSLEKPVTGSLSVNGLDAIEMNTLTGNISGYPALYEGGKVFFPFSLPPAGSLLLYIPAAKQAVAAPVREPRDFAIVASSSPMTIMKDKENAMTIEFCDLQIGDEVTKDLHTYYAADKVYKANGFKNGNPWNTSVQFKTRTVDRDTFGTNTGFTATYHFSIKDRFEYSSMKAVVERPYLWSVVVNGTEVKAEEGKWWLDREFGVFKIGDVVKKGDNTVTLKVSPMKVHAEIEPVYIVGDFSVKPAEKGWIIESPVKILTMGSWKEQGIPFYSWGVTYSKEFNIEKPEGKYKVTLGKWSGTIAEVSVNGQPATLIAFPPYTSDVTGLIKPGTNNVEIKVIGSNKNLLGPHFNNPAPGLVSPGHFRNVKSYPAGKDYQLLDYGLFEEFILLQGK
jgi:hypothetical protein